MKYLLGVLTAGSLCHVFAHSSHQQHLFSQHAAEANLAQGHLKAQYTTAPWLGLLPAGAYAQQWPQLRQRLQGRRP